jgi:hypothetical protein
MGTAGLQPRPDQQDAVRVPAERLAAFDALMAQGGIEAVITKLKEQDATEQVATSL